MKNIKLLLLAVSLLLSSAGYGQQMKQHIDMRIDSIGNATFKIYMKMNAAAWQNWLQTSGLNPAALKRSMEREMPAYFLDDFKLTKDDMERSFELSLKAYGVCKIDKRGNWILETDDRNIDLTKLDERKYMYINSPVEFGGKIKQTTTIQFPDEATDIQIGADPYGKTIFKFHVEESAAPFNAWRWSGVLFLLIGGVWMGANLKNR